MNKREFLDSLDLTSTDYEIYDRLIDEYFIMVREYMEEGRSIGLHRFGRFYRNNSLLDRYCTYYSGKIENSDGSDKEQDSINEFMYLRYKSIKDNGYV